MEEEPEAAQAHSQGSAARRDSARPGRPTVALALAAAAVLCAAIAGLVPAQQVRGHYAWPPPDTGAGLGAKYTPLLLSRHVPESLEALVPCDLPGRAVVLSTARQPATAGGLSLTTFGGRLRIAVGSTVLARVRLPPPSGSDTGCVYRLELEAGRWTLVGEDAHAGGPLEMPIVTGLFSDLDLVAERAPSVQLTSTPYGSRSTLSQTILRTLGSGAALAALALVAFSGRRRRPWQIAAGAVRRAAAAVTAADAAVLGILLCWWVLGPAFFDDGWVMASQKNFTAAGDFSTYYDSFGVGTSLSYWLQWTEHWLFTSSNGLLVLRVLALVCLAATWIVSRWIFTRVRSPGAQSPAARWALASAFVVGALAWGMTLRPEPVVALLIVGVLACTLRFLERESAGPLALAAVLLVLAVTSHPAGLAGVAPLLVAGPRVLRWMRPRLATSVTIGLAAAALAGILAVLGSDFADFRATATSLRTYGAETSGWRDELNRYSLLSRPLYGSPLRREWVALALLTVLAYLLRRRRDPALDLYGASLGLAFVLLIATPSKVPWHFGALIGLAAIAVASETARFVADARSVRGWHVRPFVVVGAAMLAAAWSWFPRNVWSDLDLRTLDWTLGIEDRVTLAKVAGVAPLVVLACFALLARFRSRRPSVLEGAWQAAAWTVPVLAVPLVAFTLGIFAADTAKTASWTLGRQNLETLTGDLGCGLADDAVVPALHSMRGLSALGATSLPPVAGWVPAAPVRNLDRFTLGAPTDRSTAARSPWFRLPDSGLVGFFVAGTPQSPAAFELQWGRARGARITQLGRAEVNGGFADAALPDRTDWRFYAAGDLPVSPSRANVVRLATATSGADIAVTRPVGYRDEPLAALIRRNQPTLALPNLRTYVPCVAQPRVRGTADVPGAIIGFSDSLWPLATGTSPFDGALELYPLVRLPLSDSQNPPDKVSVYVVARGIPGAVLAPAVESRSGA
jgi:hypothetical protein